MKGMAENRILVLEIHGRRFTFAEEVLIGDAGEDDPPEEKWMLTTTPEDLEDFLDKETDSGLRIQIETKKEQFVTRAEMENFKSEIIVKIDTLHEQLSTFDDIADTIKAIQNKLGMSDADILEARYPVHEEVAARQEEAAKNPTPVVIIDDPMQPAKTAEEVQVDDMALPEGICGICYSPSKKCICPECVSAIGLFDPNYVEQEIDLEKPLTRGKAKAIKLWLNAKRNASIDDLGKGMPF